MRRVGRDPFCSSPGDAAIATPKKKKKIDGSFRFVRHVRPEKESCPNDIVPRLKFSNTVYSIFVIKPISVAAKTRRTTSYFIERSLFTLYNKNNTLRNDFSYTTVVTFFEFSGPAESVETISPLPAVKRL